VAGRLLPHKSHDLRTVVRREAGITSEAIISAQQRGEWEGIAVWRHGNRRKLDDLLGIIDRTWIEGSGRQTRLMAEVALTRGRLSINASNGWNIDIASFPGAATTPTRSPANEVLGHDVEDIFRDTA
jgi:hypothetical protein